MLLVRLQRHGHRPVALVGGGTGLIGDPGGKASERPLADRGRRGRERRQDSQAARTVPRLHGPNAARMIDNAEWLGDLRAVEFMRDVGKHFTVNYMLQKDSVKGRMEAGISYTEFSYMLLQAYDFLELRRRHDVRLQMGGSDQWGNITAGIELIRRALGADAHAITSPLVTTSAGTKFGKTEAGAVWLDATLTSPYKFYQFLVNVDDRDVGRYLRLFTLLSQEEIEALEQSVADQPEQREAQRALARRGDSVASTTSGRSPRPRKCRGCCSAAPIRSRCRSTHCSRSSSRSRSSRSSRRGHELTTYDVLEAACVGPAALSRARATARRMVQQGGVYLNGRTHGAGARAAAAEDLLGGEYVLIRKGARSYGLVEVPASGAS